MWIRIFSYLMATVAVGASFLFGHDRVLRFMDRHLPLRPKRPPVRPVVRIAHNFIDEHTAVHLPEHFIPPPPSSTGYQHRV